MWLTSRSPTPEERKWKVRERLDPFGAWIRYRLIYAVQTVIPPKSRRPCSSVLCLLHRRHLVDSVFIDWNYDGEVFRPSVVDMPSGYDLVEGSYSIPGDAGSIRIKIVDVLSEAFEVGVQA